MKKSRHRSAAVKTSGPGRVKNVRALPTTYFNPRSFARKRAAVLGLARSGLCVTRLLARKGIRVFASDSRPRKELRAAAAKLPRGVRWEGGGHSDRLLQCHFAVKSPGIAPDAPILRKFKAAGIPVFSELEVALSYCPTQEIVAVTGTNGKTTTAAMTAAVFKAARRKAHLYGNIGVPLSAGVSGIRKGDTIVLEVSSYQLEDSLWLRPAAAAILNVTPDHIEHHKTMAAYRAAKARIFRFQDRAHSCVFNAADPSVYGLARDCRARKLFFGHEPSTRTAAWIAGGRIMVRLPGTKKVSAIVPPALPGAHNLENAMAAALLSLSRGVTAKQIARGFQSFRGVEHRIEECGNLGGIRCINDSKATNVDSTLAALRSLDETYGPLILILGGQPKGGGFKALRALVSRRVKAVLTIGNAASKIEEDLQGASHVFPCSDLKTAVTVAAQIGQKGDTLLLSPACASFDQFQDYEDRGRRFKALIRGQSSKK